MKSIIIVAIVSAFFISCKKETETITIQPTETAPISRAFFLNGNYKIDTLRSTNLIGFELGCLFSVAKTGKIVSLGTKMHGAGTYRVTLWDTEAVPKTPLAQTTVTQTNNGVLAFSPIAPISVAAGKIYLITFWMPPSSKFFAITLPNGGNIPYPINAGNITITGYRQTGGSEPQNPIPYPTFESITQVAGLPDIEFKAD